MVNESVEQNRYQRALTKSYSNLNHPDDNAGKQTFWDLNHRVLTEHAPVEGSAPACNGCGEPWPCEMAETAMKQVGVWS